MIKPPSSIQIDPKWTGSTVFWWRRIGQIVEKIGSNSLLEEAFMSTKRYTLSQWGQDNGVSYRLSIKGNVIDSIEKFPHIYTCIHVFLNFLGSRPISSCLSLKLANLVISMYNCIHVYCIHIIYLFMYICIYFRIFM